MRHPPQLGTAPTMPHAGSGSGCAWLVFQSRAAEVAGVEPNVVPMAANRDEHRAKAAPRLGHDMRAPRVTVLRAVGARSGRVAG